MDIPTPTALTRLAGSYQRKAGLGRQYAYAGVYGVNSNGTWWLAKVSVDGKLKGNPIGVLERERSPKLQQIARLIERQIEELDQVAE